ncbi:Predicted mRNA cap-binding protein related to eIF-4E [Phaffia rhodozyma]|uniref:Predicted mRNA cap-binding protein related to eIF-4E n=1 Tax=Phaffia rhodozyma TaxID=264483 RepID=A0A0F7SND5_PHARH|nr:Predicted mRNA cap-binding protein related to eIF-4E [Phaffia rhodozyma]
MSSRTNGTNTSSSSSSSKAPASSGKRTLSLSMSSAETQSVLSGVNNGSAAGSKDSKHPCRISWLFWYTHRQPGAKITTAAQYEDSIKKIGGFASIESFWTIYSHLNPPSSLPPVTDVLLFASSIRLPIWEEVPKGAKFTLRLRKGLADRLWEDLVLASVGDQFEEEDGVVGVVLSVRTGEDVISVWTEKSHTDGGARVKETIYRILNLPPSTVVDYKLNSEPNHHTPHRHHSQRNGHLTREESEISPFARSREL